jgi:hypothetical protein
MVNINIKDRLYVESANAAQPDAQGRFEVTSETPVAYNDVFHVWNALDLKRNAPVTIKFYLGEKEAQITAQFHALRNKKDRQEFFTSKTGIIRQYNLYKDEATGLRFASSFSPKWFVEFVSQIYCHGSP